MKLVKNNWLYLVCFSILLCSLIISTYKFIDNDLSIKESYNDVVQKCINYKDSDYSDESIFEEKFDESKYDETMFKSRKEYCEYLLTEQPFNADFYWMFIELFVLGFDLRFQVILTFFCIVCPALFSVLKYIKNNKNCFSSKNKRETFKFMIKEMFKSSLMLPLIFIISVLICRIYTGGFLGGEYWTNLYSESLLNSPFLFIISYLFKTFVSSIVYVCIGFSICRFIKNPFIASILSFILLLLIVFFFELVVDGIILIIFNVSTGVFGSLISPLYLFDKIGIVYMFIIPLVLVILSLGITYKLYSFKKN